MSSTNRMMIDQATVHEGIPRTYKLRRSQHLGYGFIAGFEYPTMVKTVDPIGPSYERLLHWDIIMAVNGINVERAPREQIIRMILRCEDEMEITVRQPSYEELIRAKNLSRPDLYMANKVNKTQQPQQDQLGITSNASQCPPPTTLYSLPSSQSPLNRLVTSISQQRLSPLSNDGSNQDMQPVQNQIRSNEMFKHHTTGATQSTSTDANNNTIPIGTSTLGRPRAVKYGRHSPLPQRCKSSMDQSGRTGIKKQGDVDNDQPLLKRSNTMRPIRPPERVMEIFKVVIKIFFEDGQTKVLSYNQDTTVGTILETLNNRLVGSSPHSEQIKRYFGLTVTVNSDGSAIEQQAHKRKLLYVLAENDSIIKIRQLPYAPKLRLLYRMIYPPADVEKLYTQDKVAFEYLYKQSCNDLRADRFRPELSPDQALKLGALHLVEYVHSNLPKAHGNGKDPKLYMKLIKKTPGFEYFLPASLIEGTRDKRGKRVLGPYKKLKARLLEQLRKNFEEFDFQPPKVKLTTNLNRYTSTSFHELSLPESFSPPSDYVKLVFLNFLSQLPCYGHSEPPVRSSLSPIERSSVGECSSSLESVPRTSDSSPLIRQDRSRVSQNNNGRNETANSNSISKLAQMNSMRSLSTTQPSNQTFDGADMTQTPSIESISSVTFNLPNSPSPQQTSSYMSQQSDGYQTELRSKHSVSGPSPMPRQQISHITKPHEYNSIDKLYDQRYTKQNRSIDDLLRTAILLPPPPISATLFRDMQNMMMNRRICTNSTSHITPILTDRDLDRLRVPPPPKLMN